MSTKRMGFIVFAVIVLAGACQLVIFFPELPAKVVTQSDAYGKPITTLAKAAMGGIDVLVLILGSLYFICCGLFIHKLPTRYLKILPNRDYWLAPDKLQDTMDYLATSIIWLGNATMLMFLTIFQMIYMVNTNSLAFSLSTGTSLATTLYLTYVFIALIRFKNHFRVADQTTN
ncbi:MAG: hypothetical protein ACNI3A_17195 [Desulfovibrio sp.]|uniref:hypothetical protein n=1 Tax=Desulfovibrio sp. 7SRBS1 TaxID=3378064 RepID=UPI003B4265FA